MNTAKSCVIGVLALGLAVAASGYESADRDWPTASDESAWQWGMAVADPLEAQGFSGSQVGANLHRAKELEGTIVRSPDGEELGSLYDLVLTPDLDHVSYVVIRDARGFHAVPWSAIRTGSNGNVVASVAAENLAQEPGFRHWPAEGNPRWLDRSEEQPERPESASAATDEQSIQERRFSRLEGTPVKGREDRKIGSIRDLVVSTGTGEVAYTVVSTGGFLGLGRKYAAIPNDAVELDVRQRTARVDVDRRTLQANAFSPNAFPDLSDPLYAARLNQAYGIEQGSTVLGYVPGEEE